MWKFVLSTLFSSVGKQYEKREPKKSGEHFRAGDAGGVRGLSRRPGESRTCVHLSNAGTGCTLASLTCQGHGSSRMRPGRCTARRPADGADRGLVRPAAQPALLRPGTAAGRAGPRDPPALPGGHQPPGPAAPRRRRLPDLRPLQHLLRGVHPDLQHRGGRVGLGTQRLPQPPLRPGAPAGRTGRPAARRCGGGRLRHRAQPGVPLRPHGDLPAAVPRSRHAHPAGAGSSSTGWSGRCPPRSAASRSGGPSGPPWSAIRSRCG